MKRFRNCRGLKLDKKSMSPAVLSDVFLLIDKVLE